MNDRSLPTAGLRLHNGRIVLTPEDPVAAISIERVEAQLRNGCLIGDALAQKAMHFSPGARLFDYIGFTGCAVQLDHGQKDEQFEIALEGPYATPQPRFGRNTRPPRCAQCRQPLPSWREQLGRPDEHDSPLLSCHHCETEAPARCWSWGRHGGYGRVFIRLEPVFPGEGRPLPALFTLLEQMPLGAWRYFFVQD